MNRLRYATWLSGFILAFLGLSPWAFAQANPNEAGVPGVEVLTRGPVHEAFAEPVVFDPKPGPIIPKEPPPQVEELPPDQKPEGTNIQWIPGYWSWDDGRNDYLWVSGIWRDVPPGRQWVPGYWNQVSGGFQWTAGAWVASDQGQAEYLPEPPQSLEVGPNGPSPSADATWAPGCWYWQETRYVWRPGYWVAFQPNWLWVPAHYIWTPNGYLYVNGYWDHPLTTRGLAFAPVYFQQPVYVQPNFVYTPTVGLLATALASSLFVRPAYNQYCFGDYFAANHYQAGIYPWYSYHESRYGYDPLFSHYAAVRTRRDPRWVVGLREEYRYRRDHPDARPAHTFVQQQTIVNNITNVNVTNVNVKNVTKVQNLVIGRPIQQLALRDGGPGARSGPGLESPLRFERIDETRRQALASRAKELNEFRRQRIDREREFVRRLPERDVQANRPQGPAPKFPDRPRRLDLPRSPVAAAPLAAVQQRREANAAREAAKAARASSLAEGMREAQAAKAARNAEAVNAAREAQAAKAARGAEARNAAREAQAARAANAANAAREAQETRQTQAAAKAAREANAVNAAREAQAAKAARAAEAANAMRESQAAAKAARAANAANAAREAQDARQAQAAAKAARDANAVNAAREAQAARQAQAAAKAARATEAANAMREAQAARAAQTAEANRAANAARAAEAANARARAREFRQANPPQAPAQPQPDPNRRPGNFNQFRQQRHDPNMNQIPPQFRRPMPENPQPQAIPKAQRRDGSARGHNKPDRD